LSYFFQFSPCGKGAPAPSASPGYDEATENDTDPRALTVAHQQTQTVHAITEINYYV